MSLMGHNENPPLLACVSFHQLRTLRFETQLLCSLSFQAAPTLAPLTALPPKGHARRYCSEITSPLRSAAMMSPAWRPDSVSTAPF
jgi:hypothetical protein